MGLAEYLMDGENQVLVYFNNTLNEDISQFLENDMEAGDKLIASD